MYDTNVALGLVQILWYHRTFCIFFIISNHTIALCIIVYYLKDTENRFAGNSSLMEIFDNILERDFLK